MEVDGNSILVYLAIILGILLLWRLWIIPVKWALRLSLNTVLGGAALLLLNTFGGPYGLAFAINPLNAFIVGVLGVPGVGLLWVLKLILKI